MSTKGRIFRALLFTGLSSAASNAYSAGYYVDCGATANGTGTLSSPWNSVASVNNKSGGFLANDWIMFRRGTTCSGMLQPKGSGSAGLPITLSAYDTTRTAPPIINGGSNQAAIKLLNQEYWVIEKLQTTGGTPFGIYVTSNTTGQVYDYIRIRNVVVANVTGPVTTKQSGLVVVAPATSGSVFNDVLIDNVTAHDTTQWTGIRVAGQPPFYGTATSARSTNVTVRNSTVYNVGGDGIILSQVNDGLIENSVAHDIGQTSVTTVGTPGAIWAWGCKRCTVQLTEAYNTDSPRNLDGGAYDIDFYNDDHVVQYNYGHDLGGYCISVFGANNYVTKNSVIRYNICSNAGRHADLAYQGSIWFTTWEGGSIDGLKIYNNTIYANPISRYSAIRNVATSFTGTLPRIIKNNIIYSSIPNMVWNDDASLTYNNNIYWNTNGEQPIFGHDNIAYTGFANWKAGSGQDANSFYTDPLINNPTYSSIYRPTTSMTLMSNSPAINKGANVGNMGSRDFFGNSIPLGGLYDIGAHEKQ
jgi:hypothetical protein